METMERNQLPDETSRFSGNLYYVRLTTPLGLFYKLGFTKFGSVRERLAFQGNGHEEHIHHVFCFTHFNDALKVEKALHRHFGHRAAFPIPEPDMPFFENGQSELYVDDILGMDEKYTEEQYAKTSLNIKRLRMKRAGKTDSQINKHIKSQEDVERLVRNIRGPLIWLMRTYEKVLVFLFGSAADKAKRVHIQALIRQVQNAKYDGFQEDAMLASRARLDHMQRQFLEIAKKREQSGR